MSDATNWMRGFIVRQDIPKFAVSESPDQDGKPRTFLNFYLSELREPDRAGNTHTLYCQEYDPEQRKSVGDKIYIGKMKPVRSASTSSPSSTQSNPNDESIPDIPDDLPF